MTIIRTLSILLSVVLFTSCGSVAPMTKISASEWTTFNHKTKYAVENRSATEVYLTVKYSSYTFLDKSSEAIPTTRSLFKQIARDLGARRGRKPVIDEDSFYSSTGYNGITGISETLVSNSVRF